MAFEIKTLKDTDAATVVAKQRLCRTEDDRLVGEDDPEARWLFCTPGQEIPRADAEKYGLVKQAKRSANKERADVVENKSAEDDDQSDAAATTVEPVESAADEAKASNAKANAKAKAEAKGK